MPSIPDTHFNFKVGQVYILQMLAPVKLPLSVFSPVLLFVAGRQPVKLHFSLGRSSHQSR